MTWQTLLRASGQWFFPPRLQSWEIKILRDLRRRVPHHEKQMLWILSSGTQSVASVKAIGLTHLSVLCAADAVNLHLQSDHRDRWLLAIPAYHIGGLAIYARAHLSGARVYALRDKWSAENFSSAVVQHKINLTSLVPTQVYDLVAARLHCPPSLRAVVVGGGALPPMLYQQARFLGWPLLPSYGLTECASQVATATLDSLREKNYPALKVLPHVEIELRAQRVYLRSPAVCRWVAVGWDSGQYSMEDPRRQGDWMATEDMAEWTGTKQLLIIGRQDDIVKINGTLVAVPAIEHEIAAFFAKAGCLDPLCIFPVPHAREGHQLVMLFDSDLSLRVMGKMLAAFNLQTARLHRVRNLGWLPRIPRNELGKVRRQELRALF